MLICTVKPSAVDVGVPKVGVFAAFKIVATCTAVPLVPPNDVTLAVRLPRDGGVANVTVNRVEEFAVTVPTVPLLRVTVLVPTVSNPVPSMTRLLAVRARLAMLDVTVGAATIVATCTALPLLIAFVVTTAVRLPRDGAVLRVTVN